MQRKRLVPILFLLFMTSRFLSADVLQLLKQVDELHEAEQYPQCMLLLEEGLGQSPDAALQAQIFWRMSRATLFLAARAEDGGAPKSEILEMYRQGEESAGKAISLDRTEPRALYWKASNIGKWGKLQGVLQSLAKAEPMKQLLEQAVTLKPDHPDSYYVLGQLYEKLPGFPLSFGNISSAVSLGRLSTDIQEREMTLGLRVRRNNDFATQLASHLWNRDWNRGKREAEQGKLARRFERVDSPLEKGFAYEGTVRIPAMSDREEAKRILDSVIGELQGKAKRAESDERELKTALELRAEWSR